MNFKIIATALTAFAAIMSLPAQAQNYDALRSAAVTIYETCAFASDTTSEACACVAGYYGGLMTDRQFDIAARLARIGMIAEGGGSEAAVNTEVQAYLAAGYTVDEGSAVEALLIGDGLRGEVICGAFEGNASV